MLSIRGYAGLFRGRAVGLAMLASMGTIGVASAQAPAAQPSTAPVHVIAELFAKSGQEDAMRWLLSAFAATSRTEPGCLSYALLEVQGEAGHFLTVETWADKAAIDAHMNSPTIKAALPTIGPMLAKPFTQTLLTAVKN